MNNINQLFFELIRVSIGTQDCLSRTPTASEWGELYAMAKKQSLVGICFVGVEKSLSRPAMPETLYDRWREDTEKIRKKNEVVNMQCVELQRALAKDGFKSCILKGQGVAQLYGKLAEYRQSGDIDVWVDAPKETVVAWAEGIGECETPEYLHVEIPAFCDTEVEIHYIPAYMRSMRHNKRLLRFCEEHKKFERVEIRGEELELVVPAWEFDVVYLLSHMYRHLFGLGIGLRQLMDYYFLLVNANDRELIVNMPLILSRLGMLKFAGAVMYVMREVFHLEEQYMICPVDENSGSMLLDMVMHTGNFGKMDKGQQKARSTIAGNLMYKMKQWWLLVRLYPEETFSAPVWAICMKLKHW